MEFLFAIALFLAKAVIIVVAVAAILILIIQAVTSGRRRARTGIDVEKLNERYRTFKHQMQSQLLGKKEFKHLAKAEKKVSKTEKESPRATRLFVLDFDGDIRATATTDLREEITAILSVAKAGDEVVLKLESGGGLVTSYGLAASQLARLKPAGIKLTVCVDKVAASGGYMMACVADQILAAPFAVLGSIGVIAQVPNFSKVLKKNDIDYREVTAGAYKRTVTMFGEITEPGLAKFREQIEETHQLFKSFVVQHRPKVDIARAATGEYWYGTQCVALGLVDGIRTSDDYLVSHFETADVFSVTHHGKRRLAERVSESLTKILYSVGLKFWSDVDQTQFGKV
jgi:serine protease SohB